MRRPTRPNRRKPRAAQLSKHVSPAAIDEVKKWSSYLVRLEEKGKAGTIEYASVRERLSAALAALNTEVNAWYRHAAVSQSTSKSVDPWQQLAPLIRQNIDPPVDVLASLIAWNGVPDEFRGYVALRMLELTDRRKRSRPKTPRWELWTETLPAFLRLHNRLNELRPTFEDDLKGDPYPRAFAQACSDTNVNWSRSKYEKERLRWRKEIPDL